MDTQEQHQPEERLDEEFKAVAFTPSGLAMPLRVLDVDPRPVEWLWPGTIPIGKVTVIAGDPGRGKSLITLDLAARVSTAAAWPCGTGNAHPPSRVLLISAEDDVPDTIRPRLDANGADPSRIHFLSSLEAKHFQQGFELPRDFANLEELLIAMPDVRLVVLDPLMAFISTASVTNHGMRAVVASMQALAARRRIAAIFITHLTKSPAASPLYRAMGSVGLVASARAVHVCWPEDETPGRCLFVPLKCNLAQSLKAFAYTIQPIGEPGIPVIQWEPEPVPLSLLSTSTANPIPRVEDARCAGWLSGILAEGPVPVSDLNRAAKAAGFSRNALRRAKKALGVTSAPVDKGGDWEANLPQKGDPENASL